MSNTATKKVTKRENFQMLLGILAEAENAGIELDPNVDITYESLKGVIEHEIELLDNKAIAAKERAAKNKAKGDELRGRIYDVLDTEEFKTIKEVEAALGDPDVSAQMITARLTQLVNLGQAEKDSVTVGGEGEKTRKLSGYRKVVAE